MRLRNRFKSSPAKRQLGSIELIVLGLITGLVVVIAVPLLTSIGQKTANTLSIIDQDVGGNIQAFVPGDGYLGPPQQATPGD